MRPVISTMNILMVLVLFFFRQAGAEMVTLTITAQVQAAEPCTLKNDVTVLFGNMRYDRLDGEHFARPVNYQFYCNLSAGDTHALSLMVKGSAAGFDNTALGSDKEGVAIRLKQADTGQLFPVNRWVNFTYPDFPVLQAAPLADPGVVMKGGAFRASATLLVAYQ